jgi:DNA-binding beta-propeller fold protein YncE
MTSLVHLDTTAGEGQTGEGVTVEPLGLSMSPSGRVLLASYSLGSGDTEEGYVAMLRVDGRSGAVQASQNGTVRAGTRPVGVAFDRDGSRAVVVDAMAGPQEEANVRLFSVDEEEGTLTQEGGVRVAGVPASAVFVSPRGEEQGKEG